jgi:ADP-dependent NAD(P)H-hydrate dehydratase / NAD(P)H-hydrate epimerase
MKLVRVDEMQAIEREADAQGLTYDLMMENAGRGLAEVVTEVFGYLKQTGVMGLVGSGNNGGDTLVALTYLAQQGWSATACIVRARQPDDALVNRLINAGGTIEIIQDPKDFYKLKTLLNNYGVLLDGILGTGIRLPLRDEVALLLKSILKWMNELENLPKVVAVDCPSGVDCETGQAAPDCIPADLTVTMAAIKMGLIQLPANKLLGELRVVSIGLEDKSLNLTAWKSVRRNVADLKMVRTWLPPRPLDAHKGTFGTALLVAGSLNYTGATLLAGEAAFRVGAGLITLAIPDVLHPAIAGHFPESTWLILPSESGVIGEAAADVIFDNLERTTAMMLGPGFGIKQPTSNFLKRLFNTNRRRLNNSKSLPPLIIDADGLKLLTRIADWPKVLPAMSVLTPHPGEMSIMTGLSTKEIQDNRLEIAERFAKEWGHVIVLKGANSIVASPDDRTTVILVATPALARAGTGDVLSGLIAGLLAQGIEPFRAAVTGSWIHAQAGIKAADKLGSTTTVLARDILAAVISVVAEVEAVQN